MSPNWQEAAVFRVGRRRLALDAFALVEVVPCRRPFAKVEPWSGRWLGAAPGMALRWRELCVPAWSASALAGELGAPEPTALVIGRGPQRLAVLVSGFEGIVLANALGQPQKGLGGCGGRLGVDQAGGELEWVDAQELFESLWPWPIEPSQRMAGQRVLIACPAAWAAISMERAARAWQAATARVGSVDLAIKALRQQEFDVLWLDEDLSLSPAAFDELAFEAKAARVGFYSSRRGRSNESMAIRRGGRGMDGSGAMAAWAWIEQEVGS